MNTELTIPIDDLNHEVFRFYFDENRSTLYLDYYGWYHRDTKRHGWKCQKHYNRLDDRGSDMKEEAVLLSDAVKEMAIKQFAEKLKVKKWSERNQ
ncbi:MAG: hypothetical protein Q8O88_03820 [bacterium]|nr:hypothetical protein [bacterium]